MAVSHPKPTSHAANYTDVGDGRLRDKPLTPATAEESEPDIGHAASDVSRPGGLMKRVFKAIRRRKSSRRDSGTSSLDAFRAGPRGVKTYASESDLAAVVLGYESRMTLWSSARSIKGRHHAEGFNQDRVFYIDDLFGSRHAVTVTPPSHETTGIVSLYGVFDGHGGHTCSEIVASFLPRAVANSPAWQRLPPRWGSPSGGSGGEEGSVNENVILPPAFDPELLELAEGDSHDLNDSLLLEVMEEAIRDGFRCTSEHFTDHARRVGNNSGSTAIVALVCQRHLLIANLGDSGGLFYAEDKMLGSNHEVHISRTKLHDVSNDEEKSRVEQAGGRFVNDRLFDCIQPTRSFGNLDIHRIRESVLLASPEITTHRISPESGSTFLVLGSDGLWGGLQEQKVINVVKKYRGDHARLAQKLVDKAVTEINTDDISAVVVVFTEDAVAFGRRNHHK